MNDESARADRERLLKSLEELERREEKLADEESRLEKELAEVRRQLAYYGTLNREMKRDAVKESHRPFLDMSRSLR